MRKFNYLMSMFAIVLALGVMSCDPNEVTPDNPVEGVTLADLDGLWSNISTTYNGNTYDESVACDEFGFSDSVVDFDIDGINSHLKTFYRCTSATSELPITNFDVTTLTITVSIGIKFQIQSGYDLNSTPKTMDLKIIDAAGTASKLNIIYHLTQ